MCRYSDHYYKSNFACFDCQKSFKKDQGIGGYLIVDDKDSWVSYNILIKHSPNHPNAVKCPDCSQTMYDFGEDWRPPAKADSRSWRTMRSFAKTGIRLQGCGCGGVGYKIPSSPRKAELLIEDLNKIKAETGKMPEWWALRKMLVSGRYT